MANGSRAHRLAVIAIMLDIITFAIGIGFIFVAIGHDAGGPFECTSSNGLCPKGDTTSLGTWKNMPGAVTELMGNTSYRSVVRFDSSGSFQGVTAFLQVGCIVGSSNSTAILQLQVANYVNPTNSTVFTNIGGPVNIDVSHCPGNPVGTSGAVPAVSSNPTSLIFRAVGLNGNGVGDNPRFSSVQINLEQQTVFISQVVVSARSSTAFTAFVYVNYPKPSTTVENFDWMATNSSNTLGCNIVTDPCLQHGAGTCTVAIGGINCSVSTTFTTAFTGIPNVVCTSRTPGTTIVIAIGTISLLSAQTLTV